MSEELDLFDNDLDVILKEAFPHAALIRDKYGDGFLLNLMELFGSSNIRIPSIKEIIYIRDMMVKHVGRHKMEIQSTKKKKITGKTPSDFVRTINTIKAYKTPELPGFLEMFQEIMPDERVMIKHLVLNAKNAVFYTTAKKFMETQQENEILDFDVYDGLDGL